MKKLNLGMPQRGLLFQSYFVGMTLAHVPMFFGDIGLITLFLKFVFSIPVMFGIYFFYIFKYKQVHSRPFFWSALTFVFSLCLAMLIYVLLFFDGGRMDLRLLSVFFIFAVPSSLIACAYFALRLWLQIRFSCGRQSEAAI
ncbi:hypothetical protein [Rhizobium sp. MHM7A]|uniref:hypothetical protein n=1 Tax=Rhizobium sp. MHM7A TaxID=2583233 RepID=UPI00110588AA|nr:hypothetical protein [Rhizobium sp. MHM7A]TLX12411.1 hypothetical protein FFR93_17860 [Rhizobium sp. MHM7A]